MHCHMLKVSSIGRRKPRTFGKAISGVVLKYYCPDYHAEEQKGSISFHFGKISLTYGLREPF